MRFGFSLCAAMALLMLAAASPAQTVAAPDTAAMTAQVSVRQHPARIADLMALHELGGLVWDYLSLSPDGRALALFERDMDLGADRYRYHLVVVDLATGQHRLAAEAGDIILASIHGRRSGAPVDRRPLWSADGQWIYYLANVDGRAEIWRVRKDGGGAEAVVRGGAEIRNFARDGAGALVFETLTPRADIEAQRRAEARDGFHVDEDFAPLYSLRPLPDEDSGAGVWRFDLATHAITPASDAERALLDQAPENGPFIRPLDPRARVYAPALGVFAAAQGGARCTAGACGGALEMSWAADLGDGVHSIIFQRHEGHARFENALYAWTPGSTAPPRLIRRSLDRLDGCVVAQSALLCLQDFTTQPRRLVRIDLRSGDLSVLYDPNPQWAEVAMPSIERMDYTDAEGHQSFAHVVYPLSYQSGRAYPLVIVQYKSRGFLNAGTGGETPIFPLSAAGFVVVSVDRPEFDALSSTLTHTELARRTELDGSELKIKRDAVGYFVHTLISRGVADPQRLGITGMSDGAETLYDMIVRPDPAFAAAVASHAPTDPLIYDLQSQAFRASRRAQFGWVGPWDTTTNAWRAWWARMSTAAHAANIHTHLLLNLSESDAIGAFPLIARMETSATPVETYLYPGAFHIKWLPSQIEQVQQRTLDWMRFWLQGRDPEDAEEAARWRSLRRRGDHAGSVAAALPAASAPAASASSSPR